MYSNFEVKNMKMSDDIEIEGEVMLMHINEYVPAALSAIAKMAKLAGKFVCHLEVCSEDDFFVTEVASSDAKSCLRVAEKNMLQKMGLYHAPVRTQSGVAFAGHH